MSGQWKPVDVTGHAMRTESGWAYADGSIGGLHQDNYDRQPLLVIDPEDREQVKRLLSAYWEQQELGVAASQAGLCDRMQAALRSLLAPPKPKVYAHLRASATTDGMSAALCGKVWRAGEDVEVVGNCPNCRDLAEEWVS